MHSFESNGVKFNYNSDLSGDVHIVYDMDAVAVPGVALLEFVAEYVRSRLIAAIERADTNLLGIREVRS